MFHKIKILLIILLLSVPALAFFPETQKEIGNSSWNESLADVVITGHIITNPFKDTGIGGCTVTSPNDNLKIDCEVIKENGETNIQITTHSKGYYVDDDGDLTAAWGSHLEQDAIAPPSGGGGATFVIEDNILPICGDSVCQSGEDPINCPTDCKITLSYFILNPISVAFLTFSFVVLLAWFISFLFKEPEDDVMNYEPRSPEPVKKVEVQKSEDLAPTREEVEKYYDKVL